MNAVKRPETSAEYDARCRRDFAVLYRKMAKSFDRATLSCPYELPCNATFNQAALSALSDREMELFLSAGFRRNGSWMYSMVCRDCASCVSIRLHTPSFVPNRNQRRVLRKNSDVALSIEPIFLDQEHLNVCDQFLETRYPSGDSSAEAYYSSFFINYITTTLQMDYRVDGELMGTAIIDTGTRWMNAVYFFFDPKFSARSPGTLNILQLIELCRRKRIEYLYLGYVIYELAAMRYKKNFKPHQILLGESWQTVV